MRLFEIYPLVAIGPIQLGMSPQEVHQSVDWPMNTFVKSGQDRVDAFLDNSFQVFYDSSREHVDYIELSKSGKFIATYRGINVFATPVDELVALITRDAPFDSADPESGYSYIFPDLELACWRPVIPEGSDDEDGRFFATVGIGIKGYFSARRNLINGL